MIGTDKEISSYLDRFGLREIFSKMHKDDFSLVHIPKGDVICLKGEEMKYMYLIVEGKGKDLCRYFRGQESDSPLSKGIRNYWRY